MAHSSSSNGCRGAVETVCFSNRSIQHLATKAIWVYADSIHRHIWSRWCSNRSQGTPLPVGCSCPCCWL